MDPSRSISPQLNQTSPLDTLLRRTSSRRTKAKHTTPPSTPQAGGSDQYSHLNSPPIQAHSPKYSHAQHQQTLQQPASPLLHTQFRASTATTNTTSMMSPYRGSQAPSTSSWYSQDESLPPSPGWSQRDWDPSRTDSFIGAAAAYGVHDIVDHSGGPRGLGFEMGKERDTWTSDRTVSTASGTRPDSTALPRVVVSSDQDQEESQDVCSQPGSPECASSWTPPSPPAGIPQGRVPSRIPISNPNGPVSVNFSRPRFTLPPTSPNQEDETGVDLEERKRQVLARHGYGNGSSPSLHSLATSPSTSNVTPGGPRSTSPLITHTTPLPQTQSHAVPSQGQGQNQSQSQEPLSPAPSLYSNYSFYQLDSQMSLSGLASRSDSDLPSSGSGMKPVQSASAVNLVGPRLSPSTSKVQTMGSPDLLSPTSTFPSPPPSSSSSPAASSNLPPAAATPINTTVTSSNFSPSPPHALTPQEYLQLGITHHLANRLPESARCFELSATQGGGCGVGMLMWGLTLRHGWGCEKSEKKGFRFLRRAAECAVEDLEGGRAGVGEAGALKSELVLAIYEVGQSFYRGWGIEKDKEMAVSYFRVAARLGDPDAQQDLAFCLANGKGCKKDRKEAAKWYRAAVAQGASDVGLAWIYKEKFQ